MKLIMRVHPERVTMKEAALRNLACQECGTKIEPDAVFCASCHAPIVRRYCPGCSKLVPNNTAFCPFCGVSAKIRTREGRSLASTIVPAAVCLTLLMIFVAKRNESIRHAVSSHAAVVQAQTADKSPAPASPTVTGRNSSELTGGGGGAGVISPTGRALNLQAHELMKQRRFEEAIPVLVKAIEAFGDDSKDEGYRYALFNLGQSLRMTGQVKKAIRVLDKAQEQDPMNPLFQREMEAAKNALASKSAAPGKALN